ncbi:hypothetical protein CDAR_98291 [Caerostris darwini]|uniref:Uncharacterized protein n=1 Tax=Caerostris darwini TaxID=1538125 RepID=A0AAV4UFN6_9ARAC|nr:hypothetical protein CDAR_98291 [Caerostris darwini]
MEKEIENTKRNSIQEQIHDEIPESVREDDAQESKNIDNNDTTIKGTEATNENDSQESEENEIPELKKEDGSLKLRNDKIQGLTREDEIQESKIIANEPTEKACDNFDFVFFCCMRISLSATKERQQSKTSKPSLGDVFLKISTNRPMNMQIEIHANPPVKMDFKHH